MSDHPDILDLIEMLNNDINLPKTKEINFKLLERNVLDKIRQILNEVGNLGSIPIGTIYNEFMKFEKSLDDILEKQRIFEIIPEKLKERYKKEHSISIKDDAVQFNRISKELKRKTKGLQVKCESDEHISMTSR